MAPVKAAAIQIAPDLSGCAGTVEKVVSSIEEAARQDVEIAVFPETSRDIEAGCGECGACSPLSAFEA